MHILIYIRNACLILLKIGKVFHGLFSRIVGSSGSLNTVIYQLSVPADCQIRQCCPFRHNIACLGNMNLRNCAKFDNLTLNCSVELNCLYYSGIFHPFFFFFYVRAYLGINSMKLKTNGIDHIVTAEKNTPR